MKRIYALAMGFFSLAASAQDPYLNHTIVNISDLFGTSRYVSMGGAMGALGADISTISSNPAGISMISKNEVSLTAGASWMSDKTASDVAKTSYAKFDQIGAVAAFKLDGKVRGVNLAFNYQKKADYNRAFFGETATMASWADQLKGLSEEAFLYRDDLYGDPFTYNHTLYGLIDKSGLLREEIIKSPTDFNNTYSISSGALNSYEFGISTNINNRCFLGFTIGFDNLNYSRVTDYFEYRTGADNSVQDFFYNNEQRVTGSGFNLKFGAIVRPLESSSFRIGFALETPTWYNLKYIDDQFLETMYDDKGKYIASDQPSFRHYVYDLSGSYINYLEYKVTTPWKVRAQMGSTVSTCFAWGMEYEYANYSGTSQKYPSSYGSTVSDEAFNFETGNIFKPQHTLRCGVEFKPLSSLSLRAGYNFITTSTMPDASWDPYFVDSSLAYPTGLDYMNLSDTHIITCGAGYRYKWFFADIAYKCRKQSGEYYAFNSFYSNVDMPAIPVDVSKHSITATVGVRF